MRVEHYTQITQVKKIYIYLQRFRNARVLRPIFIESIKLIRVNHDQCAHRKPDHNHPVRVHQFRPDAPRHLKRDDECQKQRHIRNPERCHPFAIDSQPVQSQHNDPDPQLQQTLLYNRAQTIEKFRFLIGRRRSHIGGCRTDRHLQRCGQMGERRRLVGDLAFVEELTHRHPEDAREERLLQNRNAGIFSEANESDLVEIDAFHL